ncbi:unnamed protein product [Brassicogethes aeneus]|uniref:Uncharacterized protein n=1 Tax=Brassicogethes aeneus TaxID=1431903 RepID=A0A9P0FG07_BRAAE|nr:unnamed protein product [Brassicogethes aeneus]
MQKSRIIKKITALHKEWKSLQKNATRRTDRQAHLEASFKNTFDDLFDVAHADAIKIIKIQEDRDFLILQRQKGRPGSLSSVRDKKLHGKESRRTKREQKETKRKTKVQEMPPSCASSRDVHSSESDSEDNNEQQGKADEAEHVFVETVDTVEQNSKRRRGCTNVLSSNLVATIDTSKISVRKSTAVVSATASALNVDVNSINVYKSSLHRARTKLRKQNAEKVKEKFQENLLQSGTKLICHFDGKKMKIGNTVQERLPVVVTGYNIEEQLLGAPRLDNGTGEVVASAVFQALESWNLTDKVESTCTDTTSSMTGCDKGACVILERKLNRDLLYAACRHHVFEVILKGVFEVTVAVSCGPEIP